MFPIYFIYTKKFNIKIVSNLVYGIDWVEQQFLIQMTPILLEGSLSMPLKEEAVDSNNLCVTTSQIRNIMELPYDIWVRNYRRVGSIEFVEKFQVVKHEFRRVICHLVETKQSHIDARPIIKELGYSGVISADARGYAGGMLLVYDDIGISISR